MKPVVLAMVIDIERAEDIAELCNRLAETGLFDDSEIRRLRQEFEQARQQRPTH